MLLSSVFFKSLRDRRMSMLFWLLGVSLLAVLFVSIFPLFSENDSLQQFADTMDKDMIAIFGIEELDYSTGDGFLNSELFGFMLPILLIVFAIGLGSASIAGEEDKRTIEILISEPIQRSRLILEKYAFMVVGIGMLGLMVWVSVAGAALVFSVSVSLVNLAAAILSCAFLAMVFGSLSFGVGSITGKRGLSIAVGSATAAGTFVLNAISALVDSLEPAKWISPFYYYSSNQPMMNGLDLLHVAVLVALCSVAFVIGYVAYQRRDLRL